MSWTTPKTNWNGYTDMYGKYHGDYFNASDFNRIKNNLIYLRELAMELHEEFDIVAMGRDRVYSDFLYADEINTLEYNLDLINSNTFSIPYGTAPTYSANGHTMNFVELNRIECAILNLYCGLINEKDDIQNKGKRKFTFNFGMNGSDF